MLRYLVITLCAGVLMFFFARQLIMIRFLTANANDTIHNNIYINGIAVGKMTPSEAKAALQKVARLDRQVINFLYNNSLISSYTFADFGAEYDFTNLVEQAYFHGRAGSRQERYAKLRALENAPFEITGTPIFRYNEATIPERLEAVRSRASIVPVSASMRKDNNEFVITEGTPGRTPNMQEAAEELRRILKNQEFGGQIELNMQEILPEYQAKHFEQAQSLLGQFSTVYTGGEEIPRSINIRLAASHINNRVVFPGEVFSTREAIGPSTPERGYSMAAVIVDGRLVEDYGGGVCQVASTLYNALLYAELKILERANHSLKVYYLDAGFDAAIAGDYMDLKFRNNTEYPVLVTAFARDGLLQISIYGHETRPPNRTLAFVSEQIEVIPPKPEQILVDENLPSGHVLIDKEPRNGYKYELFKIVFINGEQIEREKVNTSIYRPVQGIIFKGPLE